MQLIETVARVNDFDGNRNLVYYCKNLVLLSSNKYSYFENVTQPNFLYFTGGITIAWIELNLDNMPQIVMLQPFCHKDFAIRTLGDRIKDLNQCVTLYPDIPKDKAFGAYYSPLGGTLNTKPRSWPYNYDNTKMQLIRSIYDFIFSCE